MDWTYAIKAGNIQWSFVKNVKHWVTTVGEPEVNKFKPEISKVWNASRFCVSSLRRGHANLLCIVPILVPPITGKSVTSALSFGRLLRFHHVGLGKGHVIGFSQFQQEL